jgi:hypothetical protein
METKQSKDNKLKILEKSRKERRLNPENNIFYHIWHRCNNPNDANYKYYGGRGIKCLITKEEIRQIMERDNYWNLKRPSIDRIDNDGDYTYENCRFIELETNIAKDKKKAIIQLNLEGEFIREWESAIIVEKQLKINHAHISQCLYYKRKTTGGFIWKFKEANNGK